MVWVLKVILYAAPPDAVDWKGPWKFGMSQLLEKNFKTGAACGKAATRVIAKLHQEMLAPMRYRCIGVEAGLPAGAPR